MARQGQRVDEALVERGLAVSRSQARALVLAGNVRVGGQVVDKAGYPVGPEDHVDVAQPPRFVSRGGDKLDHALSVFAIDVVGTTCADFGASTGGFTDALLQRGARRVYALDVGYGQLDYRLRRDARVVVMDRVNVRFLEDLPELIDLVTIDVSFISLSLVLPAAKRVLRSDGICVALVKPQFEAGRGQVGKGGVVRDANVHARVIERVVGYAEEACFRVRAVTRSPLVGPAGNREFVALLDQRPEPGPAPAALSRAALVVQPVDQPAHG